MRYAIRFAIAAILWFAFTGAAAAFCYQPSPPSTLSKPRKPSVPWCVNEWNRTHTCDSWEINNYNSAVERYNRDVEDYIHDLQRYVDDAVEYAKCEIGTLD